MDVQSIGFVLLMALMGGVIAVLADRLGRKLGKSRHTLFGMRPRKTAEVLTFAAGFLIPIVTILIVIALSSTFRQWLLRGAQALEDSKRYEQQASDLQHQVDDLNTAKDKSKKEFDAQNKELLAVKQQRTEIEAKRKDLEGRVASLNGDIAKLNIGVKKLEEQTKRISDQYIAAKTAFDKIKASFDYQNDKYNELIAHNTEIERANAQLEKDRTNLQGEIDGLQGKISGLEKQRNDLEQQVQQAKIDYKKQLDALNSQLDDAKSELSKTQGELRAAQDLSQMLSDLFTASRYQHVTYYSQEEVVRVALSPNLSEEQARSALNSLLRQSITEAEGRGAKGNGDYMAAGIIPAKRTDGSVVSPRDQIEEIIRRIRNLPDYMLLVATSRLNAFVGEPVALEVSLVHNPIVYDANEAIGDVRIDGSRSDDEIFTELTKFFSDVVRPAAIQKGMIPTLGTDSGLGSLTTGDVLQLIRRIKDVNAPVRVYALAAKQTRAGDRLELVFRFR